MNDNNDMNENNNLLPLGLAQLFHGTLQPLVARLQSLNLSILSS